MFVSRISSNIKSKQAVVWILQAIITYESGRKTGDLPKELHRLGKALARESNFKALADAAMDSPNLRKAIEERVCADISKECKILCSKGNPSMLRGATKETVLNFSWHTVGKEIQEKAPLFYRLLLASANPNALKTQNGADPATNERNPGICTAAAILLKNRDKGMSLVPYILSCVLKMGRTSKMVSLFNMFKFVSLFCLLIFASCFESYYASLSAKRDLAKTLISIQIKNRVSFYDYRKYFYLQYVRVKNMIFDIIKT